MATFSQSTFDKGSDIVQDFLCSNCEEKKLDNTADFYCDICVKFYCGKCIGMHRQLFTKHAPFGRGDMKKWPVTKMVEDFLLKCDVHKDKKLEMVCSEHSELCCTSCAFLNHRHCQKATISDIIKSQSKDLQQLSVFNETILKELKKLQDDQEASIRSVQSSYDEQLHKIQETRREINAALNAIEQKTLNEMKDTLTKLQASSKRDVDKCIMLRDELTQLRDAIQDISDTSNLELSFIATRKCEDKIEQSEIFLKKNSLQDKLYVTFQPNNEIVQYLSKLSGLGRIEHSTQTLRVQENPNKVITVQGKSVHNVKFSSDLKECNILAILVLPDRQLLIADNNNKNVKLLNQEYQGVSHWSSTAGPYDMCLIAPREVAVTVNDTRKNIHEVHFITVSYRKLLQGRKLQLLHRCNGIAFHQADLYITSDTALFKYTLNGKLVSKMYEDTSVYRCAVSPTGDRLYITNNSQHKLLTLAKDGSVLATFTDPALRRPNVVNVTPAGQVLVSGWASYTILQVESDGKRKLATLATKEDGLKEPMSVCYNRHTAFFIVGLCDNSSILVFKVQ
ncbi:uncharacterized protein LOC127847292 isoform X2 [Dreissena polymorpha]|uniref:uncharacterized protein LOC127847292 isoform X2 n=1 Tax=Dreissena polymorpha TaxID=45954 RepID=UPI0022649058|nr:uncharacterized protein LOC127847292 isoform X2 [Dreissena polymorpha]